MSGLFARWQPQYAEHGIPTFPVRFEGDDKKPAVKGYLRLGISYSQQLALRFPFDHAFVVKVLGVGDRPQIRLVADRPADIRRRTAAFGRSSPYRRKPDL